MNKNICPACHNEESTNLEIIELESQHALYSPKDSSTQFALTKCIGTSLERYEMLKCQNCGLEYASPLVSPNTDWYSLAYKVLSLYPSERWEFEYILNNVDSPNFMAELGCGAGFFLRKCASQRINCQGFDFLKEVVDQCQRDGLSASLMDLSNVNGVDSSTGSIKFDTIVSFHVLEHLDNPSELFGFSWNSSSTNAELWVSVPSDRRLTRLFGERDFLDQPPHHLTRWNLKSLEQIGNNNGWEFKEIIYEPIPLKQVLWSYSTRFFFYKSIRKIYPELNIFIDRILRYSLFPFALVWSLVARNKITGFAMLARYSKKSTL